MSYVPTKTLVDLLVTRCAALTWGPGNPVFTKVIAYDAPDLEQALADLFVYHGTVCLIVPADEGYANGQSGPQATSVRTSYFTLIFADVDYQPGPVGFFGDADPAVQRGVIRMKDAVVDSLSGYCPPDVPRACFMPERGAPEIVRLKDEADAVSGTRYAWLHRFRTWAGEVEADPFQHLLG